MAKIASEVVTILREFAFKHLANLQCFDVFRKCQLWQHFIAKEFLKPHQTVILYLLCNLKS